jgi:hypothetical protein
LLLELQSVFDTFALQQKIADDQHRVEQQDIRCEVSRNWERQAQVHTGYYRLTLILLTEPGRGGRHL